jgi:hypothetical protein
MDLTLEVPPHLFITAEQFLEQLLQTVVNEVGPYVPWMDEDASQTARDTQAWKCLNILRALKYASAENLFTFSLSVLFHVCE